MITLGIVCPCYNEEATLPASIARLKALLAQMHATGLITDRSFVMLVNDGSRDSTWELIRKAHDEDPQFKGLNLAHNEGHQTAILAGMLECADMADGLVTVDVDLQDDVDKCIPEMVRCYEQGYDVVYGVKVSRTADPVMKRLTAVAFYKLQKKMGIETVFNHADFRFLSRRVVKELARYGERNLYLRGIIPMIGFPSTTVDDTISERRAGESKYTLRKMLTLAVNGITSFSVTPIYWILGFGALFLLFAIAIGIYVLIALCTGNTVPGWSSLMLSLWFVGGCTMLASGVVGLYVGRVFIETKRRPLYHLQDRLM